MLSSVVGTWKVMLRAEQMMEVWLVKSQEEAEASGAVHVIF